MAPPYHTNQGRRYPPGATVRRDGVNFSVFSRHATGAELLLYEDCRSKRPFQIIRLDPGLHRTFLIWHVLVENLPAGTHYTWRLDGPHDMEGSGIHFDPRNELLDPWAHAVNPCLWDRWRHISEGPQPHRSLRAVVPADAGYDWESDAPLCVPSDQMIVYELHVGGFTRHHSSGVRHPGTFSGLVEKIPYLRSLGITHVELLPVMAFDEQDTPRQLVAHGLKNSWGYSTHSFFSPHPGYCVTPHRGTHRTEFRDMVKAFHRAGIGVILDVALSHTAEGGAAGPCLNFKGFVSDIFYHRDRTDRRSYKDYTGCGNTVNANHPFVADFIIDCLEYWVTDMHVDGFRFDLASALARSEDGQAIADPAVLWGIELSGVLAGTKIIAEAWDAAGLYQVGSFPGYRWAEWNGRYRDSVRRFVRGDPGLTGEVATRMAGSSDLYQAKLRLPINTVNFVTCHDGFTLWDLVSYNRKHNEANREDNRDGVDENFSWNYGTEGEPDDPAILVLRRRQSKNLLAILLLSQGIPMLLAGDEVLRSQQGNNNAWCQDNELGWLDWRLTEQNQEMLRFVREMIALRRRHPSLRHRRFLGGITRPGDLLPDVQWHGERIGAPPWDDPKARILALTLGGTHAGEEPLHIMLNMTNETRSFDLPAPDGLAWFRAVDTGLPSPQDVTRPAEQVRISGHTYQLMPRSVTVLEGRR